MNGKKLLFVVGSPDNKVNFIYTPPIKMGKKWQKTFDPIAEFQRLLHSVYGEDAESNEHGLLTNGKDGYPDVWESDFSLVAIVGIYEGGGSLEWEEVEPKPGETHRLSRLTAVPHPLMGSVPVHH